MVTVALVVIVGLGSAASAATTPAHAARSTAGKVVTRSKIAAAEVHGDEDAGEPGVCGNCAPPLLYHANGQVMGTTNPSGTVTITPIYWVPAGYSFGTSTYTTIINQYLTDVAAASGATSNVYSILPEYSSTTNGPAVTAR